MCLALLGLAAVVRLAFGPVFAWRELTISAPGIGPRGEAWWRTGSGGAGGAWLAPGSEAKIAIPAGEVRAVEIVGVPDPVGVTLVSGVAFVAWMNDLVLCERGRGGEVRFDVGRDYLVAGDVFAIACVIGGAVACARLAVRGARSVRVPTEETRPIRSRLEWPALGLVAVVNSVVAAAYPVMYPPDAVEYAVNAQRLLAGSGFEALGVWRLPGFSVVLAPLVAWYSDFGTATGWLNAAAVVACAAGAGSILRRVGAGGWAAAGVLAVGLDPVLLAYQRQAMPEVLAGAAATWLAVAALEGAGRPGAVMRGVLMAAAVGAGAGLSAYLRGNFQALILWLPACIGVAWWSAGRWRTLPVILGAGWLAGAAVIAPWVVRTWTRSGAASFVVGTGVTRVISAWEVGRLDVNQAGLVPRHVLAGIEGRKERPGPYDLADALRDAWGLGWGDRDRAEFDRRCEAVAGESARRHPARHWTGVVRALGSVAGLWPFRDPGFRENDYWARPLAGERSLTQAENHWTRAEGFRELRPELTGPVIDRTISPLPGPRASGVARAWLALTPVHVAAAWLCLGAIPLAWGRGERGAACVFALPFVHGAALAGFAWTGIDRYGVPLLPVTWVGAVYAAAGAGGYFCAVRGRFFGTGAGSRT